jgi:AraC-like DNA-binding protein
VKPATQDLALAGRPWAKIISCGLFVSSGKGRHPDRVLDSYELIVVRKGTLALWENNVRFDVPPGHALLLYPGRRHRGAGPFGRDLSFYWIHFIVSPSRLVKRGISVPQFVRLQRPDCVAELFHRYLDDQETRRLEPFYAGLILLQILCEVAMRPLEREVTRGSVLTGRAEEYITRHLAQKLSTAHIARALRTNPDYLNRVFRQVQEMTVTEYIHRRRVQDAAGMLRDTTDGTAEIAAACGFTNPRYFSHVFKRHHGVSPRAYRLLVARAHVNAR